MTRGPQPLPLRAGLAAERCAVREAQSQGPVVTKFPGRRALGCRRKVSVGPAGPSGAGRAGASSGRLRRLPRRRGSLLPGLPSSANHWPRCRSSARPRAPARADGEGRGRTCLVNRPHISTTRRAGLGRANPSAASARPRPALARVQAGPHTSPLALLSRVQLAHGLSPPSQVLPCLLCCSPGTEMTEASLSLLPCHLLTNALQASFPAR